MSLAERLRKKMNDRGFNVTSLADAAHIHRSYLTRLLNGQMGQRIEYGTAYRLARALSVDIHWLVSGESEHDKHESASNRDRAALFALQCGISPEVIELVKKDRTASPDASPLGWLLLMYARELLGVTEAGKKKST